MPDARLRKHTDTTEVGPMQVSRVSVLQRALRGKLVLPSKLRFNTQHVPYLLYTGITAWCRYLHFFYDKCGRLTSVEM